MENKNFMPYTDIALEAAETMEANQGVEVLTEQCSLPDTVVTWVKVTNEEGSRAMGKPPGNYITLESPLMKINDPDAHEEIIRLISKYIEKLCSPGGKKDGTVLVIGLGNMNITPDSLGPKVVNRVLVTRHIRDAVPKEIIGEVRSVAALAPGVMGLTGIETYEVVRGLTERIHPDIIIAVDALAARRVSRINSTIQLSDTGVAPGGGVGNKRQRLDKESLGVPVIAIGVPTVVDAATLANDTLDKMLSAMLKNTQKDNPFYDMLRNMEGEEKYSLISELLTPYEENMFVTPKEVDEVIDCLVNIISNGINIALHPGIDGRDINRFK